MNKVAHYLQEHLTGEVVTSDDARRHFSTDGSIFSISPSIIAYPRNESDVRKTARFTWQLAERGRTIPITPRGLGTDLSGAAIGSGILMVFPGHMNRILELDSKSGEVVVEPGANYGKLQQTLHTHGRFLPAYPPSIQYSTIGGAIANNSSGEKSIKYGSIKNFVKKLRLVLSNGEVIETKRLTKRELSKKMGLSTFEGEIYRAVDTLIEENHEAITNTKLSVSQNNAGYDVAGVKRKDGSFDLSPLFIGSQGTLGIISEITLETELYGPKNTLIIAYCDDIGQTESVVSGLRNLKNLPSTIEMIDRNLISFVSEHNPNALKNLIEKPLPGIVLIIEFDDQNERKQAKYVKKARKVLDKIGLTYRVITDSAQQDEAWKIRDLASTVVGYGEGGKRSLPIIEDGIVPIVSMAEFMHGIYDIFKQNGLQPALWGHAGEANFHTFPQLDIKQLGDRQKIFKIMDQYYKLVIELGGSTSAQNGDGRLRAPYLQKLYGEAAYNLFIKLKAIFDPYQILNPGVKLGTTLEDLKPILRTSYSLDHLHDHLPRA